MPKDTTTSGILLVDKPLEWTSHDVVGFVRGFGFKKVGHCGTLDPAATGLLVLLIGRATKLSDALTGQDKIYEGRLTIGIETFSHDADSEVVAEADWSAVTEVAVRETMAGFVGEQEQIPPMVSAKKVGGKRLYKEARKGNIIEREPRPITIHELDIAEVALPHVMFRVHCTKGTYVRTLCHDIGQTLGCGGHLSALRRLASGRFSLDDGYAMDTLRGWDRAALIDHLIPIERAVTYI
jgi:tRNA pseudouridine55 synthase